MDKTDTPALVGRWFHVLDGREHAGVKLIGQQGRVVAAVNADWYLVEWLSWLDGEPTRQSLVRLEEMKAWRFYDTAEWMREVYRQQEPQQAAAAKAAVEEQG